MKSVVVLGGSGMLGGMVTDVLARSGRVRVAATARTPDLAARCRERIPEVDWRVYDAETAPEQAIADAAWVINAIGVIKPYIHDDRADEVEWAIRVNALLPHMLARAVRQTGARMLQIATDCVYAGTKGDYTESDPHDALDVYGKTKSLGEVPSERVRHLRCSIIGPEAKGYLSLLEWFQGQKQGSTVNGYSNHQWNGVTTLQFARIALGIIEKELELPGVQHVVPADRISKAELLACFARCFGREDVTVKAGEAKVRLDRTLVTGHPTNNSALWTAAGYSAPPTMVRMVEELADWNFRLAKLNPLG